MQAKNRVYFFVSLLAVLILLLFFPGKKKKVMTRNPQYVWDTTWPQLPKGFVLGNPTGMDIDTSENLVVFHRGSQTWSLIGGMPDKKIAEQTILIIDPRSGTLISSWGNDLFIMPHGLTVDKHNNIWVTDVALNQVFKFTHDGKLLMQVGEAKKAGNDGSHFNQPTAVAVCDDGSFYVSDGYGNSRIVKFSPAGKYLFQWGSKGTGNGQFDIPHGITLGDSGKVYVADRENRRVQVFDSSGKFLQLWAGESFGNMCGIFFDKTRREIIAVDDKLVLDVKHEGSDILRFTDAGKLIDRVGRTADYSGPVTWLHDVCMDREGNIYAGDILKNTLQKYKRLPTH